MESVLNQTYKNYELIVVDDGSSDGSVQVIENIIRKHPQVAFIKLDKNQGVCKAFNTALKLSTGDFIIDLAADDVLYPNRLERGIKVFQDLDDEYGVIFGDAEWINEQGTRLYFHSEKFPHQLIPQGNVYKDLIEFYFVCSPSMMFRREVIEKLEGYDETLRYEDFDFWIRSSRHFKYHYEAEASVKKRKLKNSLSHRQFKIFNKQGNSTYSVCAKILTLNQTRAERDALTRRIQYEGRQSVRTLDIFLGIKYFFLWVKNKSLHYHS